MNKLIKVFIFCAMVVLIVSFTVQIFKQKDNYAKYDAFYLEEENFDVLFFGSSRMLVSVNPIRLYEDCGFTSYNMAQHGEGLKITYWQVENALKYTKPEVIVVDVSLLWEGKYTEENLTGLSYLHKSLDHMSLSKTKYDAIKDNVSEKIDITEYMLPFFLYHDRWDQLTKSDFENNEFYNQGAEIKYGQNVYEAPVWNKNSVNEELSLEAINLLSIYDLCEKNNVHLVLTYMPIEKNSLSDSECGTINVIENWAEEEKIPFINFATMDTLIDYRTDLFDTVHVNNLGMYKITEYLGDYLEKKYNFIDKNKETDNIWKERLDIFENLQKEKVENENSNLHTLLALIASGNYSYVISVNQDKEMFTDPIFEVYLEKLGARTDFVGFSDVRPNYTMIVDKKNDRIYEYIDDNHICEETELGTIEITYDEERSKKSNIAGYVYYETLDTARVEITVFDAKTGEFILRGYY